MLHQNVDGRRNYVDLVISCRKKNKENKFKEVKPSFNSTIFFKNQSRSLISLAVNQNQLNKISYVSRGSQL